MTEIFNQIQNLFDEARKTFCVFDGKTEEIENEFHLIYPLKCGKVVRNSDMTTDTFDTFIRKNCIQKLTEMCEKYEIHETEYSGNSLLIKIDFILNNNSKILYSYKVDYQTMLIVITIEIRGEKDEATSNV